jgi:hypothetical protein
MRLAAQSRKRVFPAANPSKNDVAKTMMFMGRAQAC